MHSLKLFIEKSGAFTVLWETCAPGHGKGPWDGIGAVIKRTIRALELRDPAKYYHRSALDVYFTLSVHFSGWKKGLSERCSVDRFNFFYIPLDADEASSIKDLRQRTSKGQLEIQQQERKSNSHGCDELKGWEVEQDADHDEEEAGEQDDPEEEDFELAEDTFEAIVNIPVGTIDPFHNIMEPITRPKKGFRPEVTSLTGIRSKFCLWVDAAKNKNLSRNQCLVMMRLWGCTCDRCIDGNFSECKLSPEFSPVILEAKPANSLAKTRSTRAINSDARRKLARQARVDDYLAVETPTNYGSLQILAGKGVEGSPYSPPAPRRHRCKKWSELGKCWLLHRHSCI